MFTKELETALLEGEIDLAVHSLKDLPVIIPDGLCVAAVLPREDPRDALVAPGYRDLGALPPGAVVGTSSSRREFQIKLVRPDLSIVPLRGNVDTRLRKVKGGQYDACVMAAAGLLRLGLASEITSFLDGDEFLPAPGQGAVAVETRVQDEEVRAVVRLLHDEDTASAVAGERAFLKALGGGCRWPVACLGRVEGDYLELRGMASHPDGGDAVWASVRGCREEALELGHELARMVTGGGVGRR